MDQLLINILYSVNNGITSALFESISASQCQPIQVHIASIGLQSKVATVVLSGNWNQLTRFKTRFNDVQEKYQLTASVQTIQAYAYPQGALPYNAYITLPAIPEKLNSTIQFLLKLPVTWYELSIRYHSTPITMSPIAEIHWTFITSLNTVLSHFRESIFQFCDQNNFEVILEPKKG